MYYTFNTRRLPLTWAARSTGCLGGWEGSVIAPGCRHFPRFTYSLSISQGGRLRWRSILALARHSDAVITTNIEDRETLVAHAIASDRLSLIPLGSNVEMQLPTGYDRKLWRARVGVGSDGLLLAYFGF